MVTQIYTSKPPVSRTANDSRIIQPNAQDLAVAAGTLKSSFRTFTLWDSNGHSERYRAVTVPVAPTLPGQPQDSAFIVAQSMAGTEQTLGRLGLVSILVGIAGIAVAGSAGITVGRAGLRPVDRLTEATGPNR
jgi:two-component system sensor histidine kinase MprB